MLACNGAAQQSGLERCELVKSLQGRQIRISDLHSLIQAWPEATNPQIAALRIDIDQTLNR